MRVMSSTTRASTVVRGLTSGTSSPRRLSRTRQRRAGHQCGGLLADPAIDNATDGAADQRSEPEQPELSEGPAADEDGWPGAPRRVHRQVRHGDAYEVHERQAARWREARSRPAPCRESIP